MECQYFNKCPLRKFEQAGKLDLKWRKQYCENNFNECVRYQEAIHNIPHPLNKLPDGTIDLKLV